MATKNNINNSVAKNLSLKGKIVLVTGGTGFMGSHLVELLIKEKVSRIVVVDRDAKRKIHNLDQALKRFSKIEIVNLDVADFNPLTRLFKKNKISVVFHLAALSLNESLIRPRKVVISNVKMMTNLMELQRKDFFKTAVLISSSEAYGSAQKVPMNEEHPYKPNTPYAASKAAADLIALSYFKTFNNDIVIVRPFNQYGPRPNLIYKSVIMYTIEAILNDKSPVVYGTGEQTRDYINVKDTARGIIEAYKHPATRGLVINLGTGKMVKIKDLVEKLIKISGKDLKIKFEGPRVADVQNHCADIKLAKKLMNWSPNVKLEEGLKETYNWFRDKAS